MKMARAMGENVYMRSLRDTFINLIPYLVISGLMTMINQVILSPSTGLLSNLVNKDTLTLLQDVGNRITNGSMNILALLVVVMISHTLATNKKFKSPLSVSIVALAVVFVFQPLKSLVPLVADPTKKVLVSSAFSTTSTSANGLFVSVIVGIFAAILFMKLADNKHLQVRVGGQVPPAVTEVFSTIFPIMITFLVFGTIAFLFPVVFHLEVYSAIYAVIQQPLTGLATSLPGYCILEIVTGLLWMIGIHPAGYTGPAIVAPLTPMMVQNTQAYAAGEPIPYIIQSNFRDIYLHIGGTGLTLGLVIAVFLFSRRQEHRLLMKATLPTTMFGINEPIIFGFPIMLNPFMFIPFVFGPIITLLVAYYATALGLVSRLVIFIPWSVPPFLNAWLASGGDIRNSILQLVLIAIATLIYWPFLKVYERSLNVLEAEEAQL